MPNNFHPFTSLCARLRNSHAIPVTVSSSARLEGLDLSRYSKGDLVCALTNALKMAEYEDAAIIAKKLDGRTPWYVEYVAYRASAAS